MKLLKDQNGMAFLLVVVIFGTAILFSLLVLVRGGVYGVVRSLSDTQSLEARDQLFGCMDEALLHFAGDPTFTDTEIDMGDYTCSLSIQTPQPDQRLLYLERNHNSITRGLEVLITVDPVSLVKVRDKLD